MIPHQRRMNPFIARMVDDMKIRNFADTTIDAYTWHVDKFCQHFGKPADELGPEEIRSFQLYLVDVKKASWSSFNQAVCGLRFLYNVTLARNWTVQHIPYGKRPKKLPMVLSDQEAAKLLECVEHPKHRAVLTICYAAGLRLSEATHLKVADIDGQRAQIRINEGKGRKDRIVPASPKLLEELREYWKKYRPKDYLFPGKTPDVPLSSATIQKACKMAAAFAGISKVISPHIFVEVPPGTDDPHYHQQTIGPLQLHHHDDLSARQTTTLRPITQSSGLAAHSAVSPVGRTTRTDSAHGRSAPAHSPSNHTAANTRRVGSTGPAPLEGIPSGRSCSRTVRSWIRPETRTAREGTSREDNWLEAHSQDANSQNANSQGEEKGTGKKRGRG
ncbi:MAG: site-specific integrase [Pirellulaceae bacterium]|nr:site-specific integrase [Pirellulaceae bacterium]